MHPVPAFDPAPLSFFDALEIPDSPPSGPPQETATLTSGVTHAALATEAMPASQGSVQGPVQALGQGPGHAPGHDPGQGRGSPQPVPQPISTWPPSVPGPSTQAVLARHEQHQQVPALSERYERLRQQFVLTAPNPSLPALATSRKRPYPADTAYKCGMLKERLQRLDTLLNQLSLSQSLTAASAAELLDSAMQMDGWPQNVSVAYRDATAYPMLVKNCGPQRTHREHPYLPIQMIRHIDRTIRVGLKKTVHELQHEIAATPLSHLDALITSLRIMNAGPLEEGLRLLLLNTGFALDGFHREVNDQGHPVGRYKLLLDRVKLNMTHVVMQRRLQVTEELQNLQASLQAQQSQTTQAQPQPRPVQLQPVQLQPVQQPMLAQQLQRQQEP